MKNLQQRIAAETQNLNVKMSQAFQAAHNAMSVGLAGCEEKGETTDFSELIVRKSRGPNSQVELHESGHSMTVSEVWGDHRYQFSLSTDSDPERSGCLVARARKNDTKTELPIRCKWSRKIGSLYSEVTEVKGSTYEISADDIGSVIVVEATPREFSDSSLGVAYAQVGPFEMDPCSRRNLQSYIANGGTRFSARMVKSDSLKDPEDVLIQVNSEGVEISNADQINRNYSQSWTAPFVSDFPKITINHSHDTAFLIQLSSDPKDKHSIEALARKQRDLIVLTIRVFHSRSQMNLLDLVQNCIGIFLAYRFLL
eukprot:GHVP01021237.1.p1 GENE.GHVP01021237.1~~GHVP01021237.1.p1  ORF type:complete len:312 (-),score=51.81 GHVP01021237.1:3899-4834(-)